MKRYYIPTSSLNFNNILSSESISPYAFYERRTFGYHRWTKTPENPNDNATVLYPALKNFIRPTSDLEDHPMVIEVWLPDKEVDAMTAHGELRLCDHTIYLTPFSSKFIFFKQADKDIALSLSASSIETKYADLYSRSRIIVAQPSDQEYENLGNLLPDVPLNNNAITFDTAINKMKGLLFGFYIGHLLSTDDASIRKINKYRKVRDIFAAILSSIDREPTPLQRETLREIFSSISPLYHDFMDEVKDRNIVLRLINIIRKRLYSSPLDNNLEELLNGLKKKDYNDIDRTNPSMEWINDKISSVNKEMRQKATVLSVENPQIIVGQCKLIDVKDSTYVNGVDKQLFISWVNDIFTSSNYNGKISTFNADLSDEITRKAKEIFSSNGQWDDSKARVTLNNLRRHIRGSEFEYSWSNDLYSAIAAVLTNGDDWQKLLLFMQGKEMTDYRIPFAIYGVLNGFAGLPRDFTDNMFLCNGKYLESIYEEFYGELFDKKLPREEKVGGKETLNIIVDSRVLSGNETTTKAPVSHIQEKENSSMQQSMEFEVFFEELTQKLKSAQMDKKFYEQYFNQFGMTEQFLDALIEDKNINKGKGIHAGARKFIESKIKSKDKEKKLRISKNSKQAELFDNIVPSSGVFLLDFEFLSTNSEFRSIVGIIPEWQSDLKWFIESHNPNHKDYSKYYAQKPTDNGTIVDQFLRLKKGRYANAKDFLVKVYLNK